MSDSDYDFNTIVPIDMKVQDFVPVRDVFGTIYDVRITAYAQQKVIASILWQEYGVDKRTAIVKLYRELLRDIRELYRFNA